MLRFKSAKQHFLKHTNMCIYSWSYKYISSFVLNEHFLLQWVTLKKTWSQTDHKHSILCAMYWELFQSLFITWHNFLIPLIPMADRSSGSSFHSKTFESSRLLNNLNINTLSRCAKPSLLYLQSQLIPYKHSLLPYFPEHTSCASPPPPSYCYYLCLKK